MKFYGYLFVNDLDNAEFLIRDTVKLYTDRNVAISKAIEAMRIDRIGRGREYEFFEKDGVVGYKDLTVSKPSLSIAEYYIMEFEVVE